MTKPLTTSKTRKRPVDKFEVRREQLAEAALTTLSTQGYAQTSLRDIAENSDFTHGVLHYYFHDKAELITYCVKHYKTKCVAHYETAVLTGQTAPVLLELFCDAMVSTLVDDTGMQRLWYDLRSQSMFDPVFAMDVADIDRSIESMIFEVVTRYAELSGRTVTAGSTFSYAVFDGLFQHTLLRRLAGADVEDELRSGITDLMATLTR